MKTLFSFLAVAALVVFSTFTVSEQQQLNEQVAPNNCFNFIRAHRQGKNVVVNWSVNDASILQFQVERSYDAEFFEPVGVSNFSGSGTYKFTDPSVFPGRIYYRITALKSDGSTECSPVETVRIVQRG